MQFSPSLFADKAVAWSCALTPAPGGARVVVSTLTFSTPVGGAPLASHNSTALVFAFLVARLASPNASVTWGEQLFARNASLWGDASCAAAFGENATLPYFSVLPGSVAVDGAVVGTAESTLGPVDVAGTFTLRLSLVAAPPMSAFHAFNHKFVWEPNMTRALRQYPHAPLVFVNGSSATHHRARVTEEALGRPRKLLNELLEVRDGSPCVMRPGAPACPLPQSRRRSLPRCSGVHDAARAAVHPQACAAATAHRSHSPS